MAGGLEKTETGHKKKTGWLEEMLTCNVYWYHNGDNNSSRFLSVSHDKNLSAGDESRPDEDGDLG